MNAPIKPAIVIFPASNCDHDMELVLSECYNFDTVRIWHTEQAIPDDVTHVILPGGFSFGDYLRAGTLAARSPVMHAVKAFADAGKPVLGICNGFQILCEARLLPGVLLKNDHDRFVCTVQELTFYGARIRLDSPISVRLPIAHREGRYVAQNDTLSFLHANHHIALRYQQLDEHGHAMVNGSTDGIAGIVGGPNNNIFGLMPHPERMARDFMMGLDGRIILNDFFGVSHEKKARS